MRLFGTFRHIAVRIPQFWESIMMAAGWGSC